MRDDLFATAHWLISVIAKELALRNDPNVLNVLARLGEQDVSLASFVVPRPTHQSVVRYYANTIAETMLSVPDLAAPLASIDGHLNWLQSDTYTDELLGEGFSKNYAWCELIGPNGFFPGQDFILGLSLLGPHRHYKDHFHPAPELYWPLTGPTDWKQGAGEFVLKPAGTIIFHQPVEHHATKTAAAPLLAVWCWPRDTAVAARLV